MKTTTLFCAIALVALIGCAESWQSKAQRDADLAYGGAQARAESELNARQKAREAYAQAHPEYRDTILNHQIAIGMPEEGVIGSGGKASHVNTTVTA